MPNGSKIPDSKLADLFGGNSKAAYRAKLLAGAMAVCGLLLLVYTGLGGLSSRVEQRQAVWLEQSVQRSAIQCYVIEGRFPSTQEGVAYLSEHYGLNIDSERYVVYYESMGDNLLPQVRVMTITRNQLDQDVIDFLGGPPPGLEP